MTTADSVKVNREYKDRLFKYIFGNPEHLEWTLSLYNALNSSSYTDPRSISITTIKEAVYMNMKNDISFLIADTMNFYESQSTYNPNMPLRFLFYVANVYSGYVADERNRINIHSSRQQKLPAPRLVCFYNGLKQMDDVTVLKLSNAFPENEKIDIEINVTMLNINYGKNKHILDSCRALGDYSLFVKEVRDSIAGGMAIENAIGKVIDNLPNDSLIKPFLLANKAEVTDMCITEYNEEYTMELFKEEGREEGRAEGREEGRAEGREEGRAEGREEGRAEGREEGRAEGREEGKVEGKVEGRAEVWSFMEKLMKEGKMKEVQRAIVDSEYRDQLYREYALIAE